ncbi:YDG domain-containing protein [Pseudotenacibaculum haliotis]|uniref:YDG domain-containing protein n=1 Tax=Pseudotenacibaculum haliotis TaxID=1862138 RepID=A0ABW5LPN4_9FLAO
MNKITRVIVSFALTIFFYNQTFAQDQNGSIDAAGDIAIVAYHADDGSSGEEDGFSFILLDDAPNGTQIRFIDEEWNGTGFGTGEGDLLWENNTGSTISAGTVISIYDADGATESASLGTVDEVDAGFNLGSAEDFVAVTGTRASPGTFLTATEGSDGVPFNSSGTGLSSSQILSFSGEGRYTGLTTCNSTIGDCLTQVYNTGTNWVFGDYTHSGSVVSNFTGSAFSPPCTAPTAQVTTIIVTRPASSTSLSFNSFTAPAGGADGYAIYMNTSASFTAPSDGDEPTADTSWNGSGQQAIYFGTSASPSVTITGLNPATTYHFIVYAYNDCSGVETYETTGGSTTQATRSQTMTITQSATPILNGGTYDFGDVTVGSNSTVTFTITNLQGATDLAVTTPLSPTGTGYSVTSQPGNTVTSASGTTTFNVRLEPAGAGATAGSLSIDTDDPNDDPFVINFTGNGVIASDTTPPAFENSTPSSSSVTQTGFTLSTDIDEAGTIYYVVVADGATAPTSAEVKAGTGSGGSGQVTSGNQAVNSGGFTHDFSVTSLTGGTAYDVYVAAEDDEGSPNLQTSPTKVDVTTTAIPLTITGLTGNNKVYDGTTAGTATGTATLSGVSGGDDVSLSGSPVYTFASANVGTGITITTSGFTLSGADAGKYTLTQPTLSADITAATLTVVGLTGNDKVYDGTTAGTATGTATLSGVIGADDVSIGGSPVFTFASANVGTGITINTTGYTISGTDSGNYTLTQPTLSADITAATLTVVGLTGNNKVYDGTTAGTATGTATLSGVIGADDVSLGGSPVFTFASANVGTGITINTTGYTISGTKSGNYTLTQPTLSADITAATLTVVGLTGNDKVYDGTTAGTATGTATLSGVIGADDVSIGGSPVFTFASANVGTGITINTTGYTISGTDSGNYTLTQPTLSADITAATLTVVGLTGNDKAYDGTTAATATGTATLSGVIGADDVSLGGSPVFTFASANVGTGITINTTGYTISGTDSGNYSLTQPTLSADITGIAVTITGLTGNDKVYDGTTAGTATGTATLSGVSGGDDVSLSGSPVYTFASANVGTGITITTSGFTLSGADAGKYTLTQPTLSADITAATLTVVGLTGNDKVYDGTTAGTATGTATLSGVIGADDVSIGGSPVFTFASANVGTGITINTTGYTISGTDSGNYTLTQPTLSADITAASLTVVGLTGNDKVYDGTTAATATGTATLSGIIGADDVSLGGSPVFTFASANVGTGITINTTGYTISGTDSGNYTLTQPTLSADITAATLTVVGLTGDNKAYDGTTAATATGTPVISGIIGADDVILSGTPVFTFASANVGTGITINTSGVSLSGTDSGNYTLTQPTLSADITTATLTVVGLTGDDKVYDGTTAATASGTATLSGVIGADDVSIGGSPVFTFASAGPGTNISISTTGYTISGTDSGNYSLTQPTLSADISLPTIAFNSTSSNGAESVSSANLQVDLNATATTTITVDYAISGTATGGSDFVLADGTLTINSGNNSGNITIASIVDDMILEADETVIVTLSNPTNATLGANTSHTYTINNNDSAAVTIEDVSGNENDGAITLTATLDNPVQGGFTVDVSTADGTATVADSDYTAVTSQTLTFTGNAGETQTFTVTPTTDTKVEANETVTVSQSNLAATGLSVDITDGATVTIDNDDTATVTIEDVTVGESDGSATVTLTLNNAVDGGFTVDVSTADNTATTAGSDYTAVTSGTETFAGNAGETQTVTITIGNDAIGEETENFTVSMDNLVPTTVTASNIDITDGATVTINDDDAPVLTATTPADDAVDVVIGANLTMTYNQNVFKGTGNILIKDDRDDSTIESIDVTGSQVTINNNVVTIDPSSDLPSETNIYVEVPAGAFENSSNQGNDAITGNTAWNFVTEDITAPTVTLSTTASSPTNLPFTVNILFSEAVTNFDLTDITVTNGTASVFNQLNAVSYSILITPTTDGDVDVSIAAGVLQDQSSNANDNEASNTVTITYDITRPTLVMTTGAADPTNGPFTLTFTFSEELASFEAADLTLVNASISDFTMVSSLVYTATITPTTDGAVSVTLEDDTVEDNANNSNEESIFSINYDGTSPLLVMSTTAANPTNGAFTVDFNFNEDVTGFDISDLVVGNGAASDFMVISASQYSALITPTVNVNANITVDVNAGSANDIAGNPNIQAGQFSISFDDIRPTVVITSDAPDPTNASFTATITFNEDVTGFDISDIEVENGTPSSFNATSASVYTVFITPELDGAVNIDVAENVAQDAATNGNEAATQYSVEYDITRPTVAITSTAANPINGAFTATFTFSEDVTGFELADITAVNGTASDFAGTGSVYTATITPATDGVVTVEVLENVSQDAATNGNEGSDVFEIDYDGTRPTVVITSGVPDPTNTSFSVTITFSEDVTGFEMADLDLGNATASDFAGTGSVYTATITPTADGGVTVLVPENVAEDAATNGNEVSNEFSVLYDATRPTIAMSTTAASPVNAPFTLDIVFSEDVTGFEMADIAIVNGTLSDFIATSASVYAVMITPTAAGDITVDIAENVAEDAATNGNEAAQFMIEYDNIPPNPPTVTHISEFTCSGTVATTGDNTLEIFGTAEALSTVEVFVEAISVGTVVTGDNGFFEFDYTGTTLADGTYNITARATDIAGNTGDLSAPFTITIDTVDSDNDGIADFCDDDVNGDGTSDSDQDCDGDGIIDSLDTDNSSCRAPIEQTRSYGFSPNGDGVNDGWVIENITAFPNNTVSVYSRSGKLVFKKKGYQNDWEAVSNQINNSGLENRLPVGPYIYVIDLGDGGRPLRGWLYINY